MHRLLLISVLAMPATAPNAVFGAVAPHEASVVRVRIVRDAGETRGTAVLIHGAGSGSVVLSFLTSARLFKTAEGERYPPERFIQLLLGGGGRLDVQPRDVLLGGVLVDLAVLRAEAGHTTLVPQSIAYEPPRAGAAFVIAGYDHTGHPAALDTRVRFESTRIAVGDRDVSGLAGCIGAPAMTAAGVFGIVSECERERCAIVSLLSMARSFIERSVQRPPSQFAEWTGGDGIPASRGNRGKK
jgi:hypothetical protein